MADHGRSRRSTGAAGSPPLELLFSLARAAPAPGALARFQELLHGPGARPSPAESLVRLALQAGVAPLLLRHLSDVAGTPRVLLQALRRPYLENIRWNRQCLAETSGIVATLRSARIAAIPLKGAVAALSLLGDEGLYAGEDLDLLVRAGDVARAAALLRTRGYRDGPVSLGDSLRASYHHSLVRERFVVELHWNLVEPPFLADPAFWWEDATAGATPAGAAWALAPEKLLLALIRRLFAHGFSPLRLFVLPVQVANGRGGPLDWERFLAAARQCRMERLSRFALAFMKDRLGAAVPEAIAAPGRAPRRLRARIERALAGAAPIRQLTRARLLTLCDSTGQLLAMVGRKLLPPAAEIRWRYGEAARGWRLPALYLLNPVLLLCGTTARERITGRWCAAGCRAPAAAAGCPAQGTGTRMKTMGGGG